MRAVSARLRLRGVPVTHSALRRGVPCVGAALASRRRMATAAGAAVAPKPVDASGAGAAGAEVVRRPKKYLWGEEHEDNAMRLIEQPRFRLAFSDIVAAKNVVRSTLGAPTPLSFSARLSKRVLGTDLFTPPGASAAVGCGQIYLKKEHVLYTGSYKERGVINKLHSLTPEQKAKGVVCSSSGNHGLAVAYHATKMGISSVVVFPRTTYPTQVKNSRAYGARVEQHGDTYADAYNQALAIVKSEGRTFIPAQNDRFICAGHGTVALDLIEQNPYLDAVVVPASGGSLLTATALAIKHVNPRIRVYGVESVAAPVLHAALTRPPTPNPYAHPKAHAHYTPPPPVPAYEERAGTAGQLPYEIMRQHVDDMLFVTETERAVAMLALMELEKTVVQGSGVAALAAVMSSAAFRASLKGKQVACVCTGGNIESSLLARVIDKGLVSDGRMVRVRVAVEDRPGQLNQLAQMIGTVFRANIRDVYHERAFLQSEDVGYTQAVFALETRGFEHIREILAGMRAAGFHAFLETSNDGPESRAAAAAAAAGAGQAAAPITPSPEVAAATAVVNSA